MAVKRDIVLAIGSYCVLMALAVKFSLVDELGQAESEHLATSVWMYVRRASMIAFACGLPLLCGRKAISTYGWRTTRRWVVIAVVLGVLIGFGNPGGFDPRSAVAIVLAAFHTFATELYFRAYLITTFARHCRNFWTPIVLSALMYGISYVTVYGIFFHPWPWFKVVGPALFTVLGIIFGYSYRKSHAFPVPWAMHFFGVLKYRLLF